MSSKVGTRAAQRRARPTCEHVAALWQAKWKHEGAEDSRRGMCPACGQKLEQRGPCPAQLRVGACRDPQGPELPPANRLNQAVPGWAMVPALPWWMRWSMVLTGGAAWLLALPKRALLWVAVKLLARKFGGRP